MTMKKLLLFCLGFFMACTAYAYPATRSNPDACTSAPCATEYRYEYNGYGPWGSLASACSGAAAALTTAANGSSGYTGSPSGSACSIIREASGAEVGYAVSVYSRVPEPVPPTYSCSGGGVLSTGNSCVCQAPDVENAAHNGCEPETNKCTAVSGKPTISNITRGYTRTNGLSDANCVGGCSPTPSGTMCIGGCTMEIGAPTDTWKSQSPTADGLYRISTDHQTVPTGGKCTESASDAPGNPQAPAPACPGFVGEVNGKPTCVGTASRPIPTNPIEPPTGGGQGNGNPAAGEKPATGEGSGSTGAGRTPSTGNGGNSGGPAAATGPIQTGNGPKPGEGLEQLNCGAPGQAPCKIDESGTPNGTTAFDKAKSDLANLQAQRKTAIDNAAGIQAPAWSFSFQLPTGCTAYNVGFANVIIDPCQYQGTIHSLMSMIWAAVTAFCIIGMVGRTIRES